MASIDHLVHFTPVSNGSDTAVANIRSLSLEGSWVVPLSLVQMEVHEIIRLALTVSSPTTATQDHSTVDLSHQPFDEHPHLTEADQSVLSLSLDQPPTASETRTLQEYRTLKALGSVFALVKYWAFMRMLWRHHGESDRVVIGVMSHSENMKQPSPLRNAKNRKRWTIVRHGLNLMEILLNNRPLLLEVMKNRHLSFTNLICLRSDFLTSANLLRLVEKTLQLAHHPQYTRGSTLSLATLSALCQEGDCSLADQTHTRHLSSSSSSPSPPARQGDSDGKRKKASSAQARHARGLGETTVVQSTKKRKRHHEASAKRTEKSERRSIPSDDSKEEEAVHDNERLQRRRQLSEQIDEDVPQTSSSQPRVNASSPSTMPVPLSSMARLRAAVRRMVSVPLLDYFYHLLETYPRHLSVAAPLHYESAELYQRTMSHRLQEQCLTRTPLYDHTFLLQHSDRLRSLPVVSVREDGRMGLRSAAHDASSAPKVWVFVRRREGHHSTDGGIASVYEQLCGAYDDRSVQQDQQPLIPAELMLQHGVHLLLVFQREGETVAMPSQSSFLPVHCVHDVVAGTTLSAGGSFCSQKHLVGMLERMTAANDANCDASLHFSEMEHKTIALPAGVFKSSPLPQPVTLTKPSAAALQRAGQVMDINDHADSAARWVDFESPDQLLYLLDQSLDDLGRRRVSPPAQLLPLLQHLCQHRRLNDEPHQAVLLALLTKTIALHSLSMDATFDLCSPLLGCGVAEPKGHALPCMVLTEDAAPVTVFRYSEPNAQPLLFVSAIALASSRSQRSEFAHDFVDTIINRHEPCMFSVTTPLPVSTETIMTRAPCCTSSASPDDDGDGDFVAQWKQCTQLSPWTTIPATLSVHAIRSSQVVSFDNLVPHSAAVRSSLGSKLSTILPAELVDGGVLTWCQAIVHSPSYYLLAISELAVASWPVHSAPMPVPIPKTTQKLGWYNHIVSQRLKMGSSGLISLASVREASKQSSIEQLYGLCTELTSLVQAADAVDEPNQCLLSPFVSTTYGELDQASVQKVIECMVENGLRADNLFLDIGCCYCKVLMHVAYATGINAYGVEAVRERSERGRRCVQRWRSTYPEFEQQTGGVEILAGDIIHNLHLLFPASHVLLLDVGFMSSTRNVLKHLWGHLSGAKLQMVFTCTLLEDINDTMERVAQLRVNMGQDDFTLYAYKLGNTRPPAAVEVFRSPIHGLGLRAARDFLVDETVVELQGEKSSTYAKDDRWPWMVRQSDSWMHVENLARFVNWHREHERVNVMVFTDEDGMLRWRTTRFVKQGQELLSQPSCWASSTAEELDSRPAL